jgi:hypothetical protein
MGLKPPDRFSAPLCWRHHEEQHRLGHRAFDARYKVDMLAVANELARLSPFLGFADNSGRQAPGECRPMPSFAPGDC